MIFSAVFALFIYLGWIFVAVNLLSGREMPWEYMVLLSYYLIWFIWTPLQLFLALRDRRIRKTARVNDTPSDMEHILLTDEAMYLAFVEYTEQFDSVEIVKFIKAVLLWKEYYVAKGEKFRKTRARDIVHLFLTPGSALEVNVSDRARSIAVQKIESSNIDVSLFDECLREVKSMISHTLWLDFLRQQGEGVGSRASTRQSRKNRAVEGTDIAMESFQGM